MLHIYFEKLQSECTALINYLIRDDVPVCDVVCVYCTINCSVLECSCPVWHTNLTRNIIKKILNEYKNAAYNYCSHPFHTLRHYVNLAWLVWSTDVIWSHKTFSEKWEVQSTHSIIYYLLLKCHIVKCFYGLHISASTWLLVVGEILCHIAFPLCTCVCMRICHHCKTQTTGHAITKLIRWIVHNKFIYCQKVKCQGQRVNKCNVAIIVTTNKVNYRLVRQRAPV